MNDSDDGVNDFNLHIDFLNVDDRKFESDDPRAYCSGPRTCRACVGGHHQSEVLYCAGPFCADLEQSRFKRMGVRSFMRTPI